ncbi:MAG: DNA-binding protein [Candidatus Acidiferrales bacterium]
MAERKPFLLRLDKATHDAVERWAADELRSLNAQIEYLLRRSLQDAGRLRRPAADASADAATENS